MKRLDNIARGILNDLLNVPDLAPDSRAQVEQWLAGVDEWVFLEELGELLRIAGEAGIEPGQLMARLSLELDADSVPQVEEGYFREVPLPPGLTKRHLSEAMNRTQRMIARINRSLRFGAGSPLIDFIQANSFSGIISNILTDSLAQVSPYKHNHDQRYPDLKNPSNGVGLEMKAANRAGKGGESHNGHSGWHLISCFDVEEESGNVMFVHVEVAELVGFAEEPEGDWHYYGSTVNEETGSQRTETYSTTHRGTSKLRDGSVYLDTERVTTWQRWRHDQSYPIPPYSPLYFRRLDNRQKVPSLNNPDRLVFWSTAKTQLNNLDPLWPLYGREQLLAMGVPSELAEVIRPETA